MADPMRVYAPEILLDAASVLICTQGVGSIRQFWHATFAWKTTRLLQRKAVLSSTMQVKPYTGFIYCVHVGILVYVGGDRRTR